MDKTFEELFQPFFLKMAVLNYKILAKTPFNEEYQQIKKHLEVLIPIYNRLLEGKSMSLNEITVNKTTTGTAPEITIENLDDYPFVSADSDTDIYTSTTSTVPILQINDQANNKTTSNDEPDVVDVEGDALVKELNKKSLELFKKLQESNWVLVEEEEDNTDDLVSDDEEENKTTSPEIIISATDTTTLGTIIEIDADDEYGEDDNDHENDKYESDTGTTLGGNYNYYRDTFNKNNYDDAPCMNIYM